MYSWGDVIISDIEQSEVESGKVSIWFIGGSGIVVKTVKGIVYVDPYLGGSTPPLLLRMTSIPFEAQLIKKADAVLCTHEHLDHCHKDTLTPIYEATKAVFIGPKSVTDLFTEWGFKGDRVKQVKAGDKVKILDIAVRVFEGFDPLAKSAVTYLLESQGVKIFHSGDSHYFKGFAEIGEGHRIDIAFISTGFNPKGMYFYLTPYDFSRVAQDLDAKIAVPIHWDLWRGLSLDPVVVEKIAAEWFPGVKVHIMRLGDRLLYP